MGRTGLGGPAAQDVNPDVDSRRLPLPSSRAANRGAQAVKASIAKRFAQAAASDKDLIRSAGQLRKTRWQRPEAREASIELNRVEHGMLVGQLPESAASVSAPSATFLRAQDAAHGASQFSSLFNPSISRTVLNSNTPSYLNLVGPKSSATVQTSTLASGQQLASKSSKLAAAVAKARQINAVRAQTGSANVDARFIDSSDDEDSVSHQAKREPSNLAAAASQQDPHSSPGVGLSSAATPSVDCSAHAAILAATQAACAVRTVHASPGEPQLPGYSPSDCLEFTHGVPLEQFLSKKHAVLVRHGFTAGWHKALITSVTHKGFPNVEYAVRVHASGQDITRVRLQDVRACADTFSKHEEAMEHLGTPRNPPSKPVYGHAASSKPLPAADTAQVGHTAAVAGAIAKAKAVAARVHSTLGSQAGPPSAAALPAAQGWRARLQPTAAAAAVPKPSAAAANPAYEPTAPKLAPASHATAFHMQLPDEVSRDSLVAASMQRPGGIPAARSDPPGPAATGTVSSTHGSAPSAGGGWRARLASKRQHAFEGPSSSTSAATAAVATKPKKSRWG